MKLVAIINTTPDSFSDGGEGNIEQRIAQSIADGASVIDIGAESTRPNATLLTQQEEWKRLQPVLQTLHLQPHTILSIDTRHPETFSKAQGYGAKWFNDVSGFSNPASVALAKQCGCDIVVMHSLSVPANPQIVFTDGVDVVKEVFHWAEKRIEELGIPKKRIIFDPGIGFGKTAAQSWDLINNIQAFKALGVRVMVGHSRKSFLGGEMANRDAETAKITKKMAEKGVDYVRVHNIKANRVD